MNHPTAPVAAPVAAPDSTWLAALVVKDGVMLGNLTDGQRLAALALVWAALPPAAVFSEVEVNAALKAQLASAARCLDTDHVELRRWLVDTGFLQRDGYGRRYEPVALGALPSAAREAAKGVLAATANRGSVDWVDGLRAERSAQRAMRRSTWQGRPSASVITAV